MKKIIYLILGILPFCTSCDDWLTVEPKALSSKDKIFESESGYSDALIGLYLEMQNIYKPSNFMVGGNIENMANNYMINEGTSIAYYLYKHDYAKTDVDNVLGSVFLSYYKVIANANVLLEALKVQNVLSEQMAKDIEGEALAIRAYMHFELLRLWGPVPTAVNASSLYLPYVSVASTDPYEYISYDKYVSKISTDLLRAEELLLDVDPLLKHSNSEMNTTWASQSDYSTLFWYSRQKRCNIYAVKGLLARFNLWIGDKQKAYDYAKEVLDAKNLNGLSKFTLGSRQDFSSTNYVFFSEHLFGLSITEFSSYDNNLAFIGRYASLVNSQTNINAKLYEYQSDLRQSLFISTYSYSFGATVWGTKKYTSMTTTDYSSPKSIPLIRLSEMFLILIETAPLSEANQYYATFRAAREAAYTPLTDSNRNLLVLKEYIKEFWSEGQSFFAYKRLDWPVLLMSNMSMNESNYILPIPADELGNYK
ncbi:MAG: RagB/SusD family nutrient uptake outer membrane protein [Bacteroidetes bacterium]|nr:RagB/SusD family nutrient uptake outer membrane protein [Bacteroidota bacterium]